MNISDHEGVRSFLQELGLPIYSAAWSDSWQPNYNTAPGERLPVLCVDQTVENCQFVIQPMRWGFIPSWAKGKKSFKPLINARAETIWEKPSFRDAIKLRRAVICVNGFYEWRRQGNSKVAFHIKPAIDPVLMIAAIYVDAVDADKEIKGLSCVLTTSANQSMAAIHDRMPVILNKQDLNTWLCSSDHQTLNTLMQVCDDHIIKIEQVSNYVNNSVHKGPECVEPIDQSSQNLF